ncbi:MAG: IMP dehydrogenase, partial [Chloroflexota bacterium]
MRLRPDIALAFDDVLLVPRRSAIRSRQAVNTRTSFSRRIEVAIPIISSNMDTVTESAMAMVMARMGGIGVIHRFMTVERQAAEVARVKGSESFMVDHPYSLPGAAAVSEAQSKLRPSSKWNSRPTPRRTNGGA